MKPVTPLRTAACVLAALVLVAGAAAQAKEAAETGRRASGYLGIHLQEITPSMAKALQLDPAQGGVLINEVVEDSPAEQAGLKEGDIVLTFGDEAVEDSDDLTRAVRRAAPDTAVEITVLRDGRRETLSAKIGERDENVFTRLRRDDGGSWTGTGRGPHTLRWLGDDGEEIVLSGGDDRGWLGVRMQDLGEQLGAYFGVEDGAGVLVSEVEADSPAAQAGLQAGDIIVALAGEKITSTGDLHAALRDTEPQQEVEVRVLRRGDDKELKVTLGEAPEVQMFGDDITVMADRLRKRDPQVYRFRGPRSEVWTHREPRREDEQLQELREELKVLREEMNSLRDELKK